MNEAEVYDALTVIFHEAFGDDSIVLRPQTAAKDIVGWDSMKMVLLIVAVEQRFAIKLRTREIDALASVGDFVKLILSKTEGGS